jgi:phosphoglycolate phosphatase-like HAD superfamily hydrolase
VARSLAPGADKDDAAASARAMAAEYSLCCARGIAAAPERRGARATLAALKRKGLRLWINSATPERNLLELLRRRGLTRYLDGARGGPDTKEQILRAVMAAERALPREIVMVGDGPDDLAGARAAGTWFVAISAENRLPGNLPFAIPDLTRLVPLIDHAFSGRRPAPGLAATR